MKHEYLSLKGLEQTQGYKILEALWVHQISEIEKSRDKAASKAQESAWRYWAGIEKGFKLAMTALQRAVVQMEQEDDDLEGQSKIEKLLDEIKPK